MSDNHKKYDSSYANSHNPRHASFWTALGYPGRPRDWKQELERIGYTSKRSKRKKLKLPEPDWHFALCKDDY